jgi:hypothetical protein
MLRSSAFVVVSALSASALAQTSELYLTSYSSTQAYVVKNGQIVRQFQRTAANDGPALVVDATIKMYGQSTGGVGREYDFNGNLLAGVYPNPGFIDCYDGATDGTRNWTISHNDFSNNFAVLVGDANWGSMQIAFVPINRSSGIAYDATDGTLWISNNSGGSNQVEHYTTAGVLLGSFPVGLQSGGGYGIALDPLDQTLWLPGAFGTAGQLHQYTKSGTLLGVVNVPGMTTNVLGAEFRRTLPPPQSYCTSGTTTNGCTAAIAASGHPNVAHSNVCQVTVSGVEGQKAGIVFYGLAPLPQPWCSLGGGSSFLCVKAPTMRTLTQGSGGTANACDGTLQLDWNAFQLANPTALGNPWAAGSRAYVQGWFRDPPACKTTSLSNAVELIYVP